MADASPCLHAQTKSRNTTIKGNSTSVNYFGILNQCHTYDNTGILLRHTGIHCPESSSTTLPTVETQQTIAALGFDFWHVKSPVVSFENANKTQYDKITIYHGFNRLSTVLLTGIGESLWRFAAFATSNNDSNQQLLRSTTTAADSRHGQHGYVREYHT